MKKVPLKLPDCNIASPPGILTIIKRREWFTIKFRGFNNIIVLSLALAVASGCAAPSVTVGESGAYDFTRSISDIDYSGLTYTPWDVSAAALHAGAHDRAAYTVMIYMNGSDLESENGAATLDIAEILGAGADTDTVNIIIFTGGTQVWRNSVVPAGECVIWRAENGALTRVTGVGLRNMGDPGTLSGFIEFTRFCFPAERYGLILWDHGGGSIAGYGHDENFGNSRLTLLEMDYAFNRAGLSDEKLEFIGFDACLMATVEMAVVASNYARYLIASEDLEPGEGWNYAFLSALRDGAKLSGAEVGRAVADSFVSYYGRGTVESLTMSVTDLSYSGRVMGALGALMDRCSGSLNEYGEAVFSELSRARYRTATFGGGSVRDNDCDMVDIGDMASRLSALYPDEAAAVKSALNDAVIYNRNNSLKTLSGLTAYYIFGGKSDAAGALSEYASLGMSGEYTDYLYAFARELTRGGVTRGGANAGTDDLSAAYLTAWLPDGGAGRYYMAGLRDLSDIEPDARGACWPVIGGTAVCLENTGKTGEAESYAVPARLNGEDGDVVVVIGGRYPDGVVMGFRREEGYVVQKGLDEIRDGDRLAFYRAVWDFSGSAPDAPELSGEITVSGGLELNWRIYDRSCAYGVMLTDSRLNERHIILPD